jgi:hypothetical protein
VTATRAILEDVMEGAAPKRLLVVDLLVGSGDWAAAAFHLAQEKKEVTYIGFDSREWANGLVAARLAAVAEDMLNQ